MERGPQIQGKGAGAGVQHELEGGAQVSRDHPQRILRVICPPGCQDLLVSGHPPPPSAKPRLPRGFPGAWGPMASAVGLGNFTRCQALGGTSTGKGQ